MVCESILEKIRPITAEEQAILDGKSIDMSLYMATAGDVIQREKMLQQGKLITLRPHTRFIDFPPHSHDYIEVVYVCTGTITHIINGKTVTLSAGELLFLSTDAVHEIKKAGEEDLAVNFIILPQFFDKALDMLGEEESPLKRFILDSLGSAPSGSIYLHFKVAELLPIQNLIENLLYTLVSDIPNKRRINQTTMGLLFLQLIGCTDRLSVEDQADELLIEVFRYIEEHYRTGSLGELAEQLHCDFYWLSREIKRCTGKNFKQLLQEKRLSQAAFLLKSTRLNVADISLAVGYENISYFHRIFAGRFGVSPFQYRTCK